ncbi:N-6 DNA Methylase [Sinosporangium album]|uniref:N-6 DNA Methylase n=1 Tax=Sinosporangium album TaxID=504805 RepID=A0A1G7QVI6_9ACTN|nr:N-6 DNA methylase [Sinosporangium album]SDG02527.1 N-6 DNA Methylase [Sinosporangium album]
MNADSLVSAAEIARVAGVTRAAVSNWRKRYPDFPAPVGGGGRNALFASSEVHAWLDRQRKGNDVSTEVVLWQELRGRYGDDMVRALGDVCELLATGSSDALSADLKALISDLAEEDPPEQVMQGLTERFIESAGRAGSDQVSTSRLIRAVRHFAGTASGAALSPMTGTVFDPACGIGSLLLALGEAGGGASIGQELNPQAARLAMMRARLAGRTDVKVKVGDSLREDGWPTLRAELVVCDPPVNVSDWGREDLLLDARWELGVPTRAESELAWLQHCYAHVAPGGRAILVMPPSVAYRKAGRRIRAELVRRGILTQLIALPAGMAASHTQPLHLWMLARPSGAGGGVSAVRLVDLTDADPDGPLQPALHQIADIPLIDLLDETVDLTPAQHITATCADHLANYTATREALLGRLHELAGLLPQLDSGPGALDGATVGVADLVRAGLVELLERDAVSMSDRLDNDFLHGFLHSPANTRRSTSASGGFRAELRGSRIPQMSVDDQRLYGTAFRTIEDFERSVRDLAELSARAVSLARAGLTSGALRPSPQRDDVSRGDVGSERRSG